MTKIFQNALLATAAAAVLFALPLAGAAEAGPRNWDRDHTSSQNERGPVRFAARRDRGDVRTPLINQRINKQARRIAAGVRTGGLTRFEAVRLRGRLTAIRTALRLARVDGRVSAGERRAILGMLNGNSQRIARLRQNRRFN